MIFRLTLHLEDDPHDFIFTPWWIQVLAQVHEGQNAAKCPHINGLIQWEAQNYLWGPVTKGLNDGATGQFSHSSGHTKIYQFQLEGLQLMINEHDVVRLDVGVGQTNALKTIQRHQHLLCDYSNL